MPGTVRSLLPSERPIIRSNCLTRDYIFVEEILDAYLTLAAATDRADGAHPSTVSRAAGRSFLDRGGPGKIVNIASLLSFQGGITVPATWRPTTRRRCAPIRSARVRFSNAFPRDAGASRATWPAPRSSSHHAPPTMPASLPPAAARAGILTAPRTTGTPPLQTPVGAHVPVLKPPPIWEAGYAYA
jgi:hypothetical protein